MSKNLPGLGGPMRPDAIDLSPLKPNEWKVWPADIGVSEAMARRVSASDPLSVVTISIAAMMSQGVGPQPGTPDDYFVRGAVGKVRRVRVQRVAAAEILQIAELRACRVCGCCQDRACNPPCSWAEDDLCSACVERAR